MPLDNRDRNNPDALRVRTKILEVPAKKNAMRNSAYECPLATGRPCCVVCSSTLQISSTQKVYVSVHAYVVGVVAVY